MKDKVQVGNQIKFWISYSESAQRPNRSSLYLLELTEAVTDRTWTSLKRRAFIGILRDDRGQWLVAPVERKQLRQQIRKCGDLLNRSYTLDLQS